MNPSALGSGDPFSSSSPVGYFAANGYGLTDMAGNVHEWCWDRYAAPNVNGDLEYPPGSPYLGGTDPRGPGGELGYRVCRGGDWYWKANRTCCAYRDWLSPNYEGDVLGFRCVRGL
jgi:formylglycine-generating enzyme required for sulfatase activity